MKKYEQITNSKIYTKFSFKIIYLFFLFPSYLQANSLNDTNKINNIIKVGEENFRFLSFATYSNGDMVFLTTAYYEVRKKIFYGLKGNGRPFFKNGTNYHHSLSSNSKKFESEDIIIKLSGVNTQKEYFLSSGNKDSYLEIYDFDTDTEYKKLSAIFANADSIGSYRNTAISLISNNSDYYYLFGFTIGKNYNFQIHNFISLENNNITNNNKNIFLIGNAHNENAGISCFQTNNKIIICFYLTNDNKYNIKAFNVDFNIRATFSTDPINNNTKNPFYRCIHLKDEVGIFTYYTKDIDNYNFYPILLLKEYQECNITNYTISEIKLNLVKSLNSNLLKNDIIKLTDKKICFSATLDDKSSVYIILINLFGTSEYAIRYYSFNITNLYKFKIFNEIRIHNYNNLVVFAFSYCNCNYTKVSSCPCTEDKEDHYSSLMILIYPNSTDNSNSYLYEYLIENYNSTINDFEINLEKEVRIENNIFGYIFNSILIIDKFNCDNIILFSSLNKSKEISSNYSLAKNEKIKIDFKDNNYSSFNCNLQYRYEITEPDLDIYDNYCDNKDGGDETGESFQKEKYLGRLTYYNIILNESFSNNCIDINCNICLNKSKSYCIVCKYNFIYSELTRVKNCSDYIDEVDETDYNDISTEKNVVETDVKIEENTQKPEVSDTVEVETEIEDVNIIILKENKEQLIKNLSNIINDIEIGKNYKMQGDDFTMIIKPTNSSSIPSLTHVNFTSCENVLRSYYGIPSSKIITFLQLEINNNNEHSLVNQIEYQVYDDTKKQLNLSLCNDTKIKIYYSIKSNSSLDLSTLSLFNDLNIDLLNIKDKFFTDICVPYSYSENDVVLEDRIINFYQNYSLCDDNCLYDEVDLDLMVISCNCSVKTNLSVTEPTIKLEQLEDVEKSMAFEIIKCYNLLFSWENKNKNIGFWIFSFLIIMHIALLLIYYYKGMKPIKDYIINEMKKNGYITKKMDNIINTYNNSNKDIKKSGPPPKKKFSKYKKKNTKEINESILSESFKHSFIKTRNIPDKIVREQSIKDDNNNKIEVKTKKKKLKKHKKKKLKYKINNININYMPTQAISKDQVDQKEINNIIGLNLININLNLKALNNLTEEGSNFILNIYTFEEAIKKDLRTTLRICYIYLLTKQAVFHAFLYKSPIVLFPLRLCLLIFIISSDLALNALFYFDDKISEKFRYTKSIILFALSKNITVILLSTVIGFIFLTLLTKLSNSTNDIRDVFRKEEQKIKNGKNYKVNVQRKKEILKEIENILNKYKIKVVIFFITEIILMLFFWYYATIFCHVYQSTQISWVIDSLITMIIRIIVDVLLCLLFAKFYRIAVDSNFRTLYKIALFFYSFC